MAAHVLNILREIAENKVSLEQIKSACGYAPGMDYLECDDWRKFYYASNVEICVEMAKKILPKYDQLHQVLGCPRNCEDWGNMKYFGLKTRRLGNFRKLANNDVLSNYEFVYDDNFSIRDVVKA